MKQPSKSRQTRLELGARFRVLLSDAGLSADAAAKLLHVTPRTIKYWLSGKVRVPYSAYRLVRVMRLFELPCEGWEGWHMHSGRLWSPEGLSFTPMDGSWWSLLVRKAAMFNRLHTRDAQFDMLVQRLRPDRQGPLDPTAGAQPGVGPVAPGVPNGAAGRAAEPTGLNLSIGHNWFERETR